MILSHEHHMTYNTQLWKASLSYEHHVNITWHHTPHPHSAYLYYYHVNITWPPLTFYGSTVTWASHDIIPHPPSPIYGSVIWTSHHTHLRHTWYALPLYSFPRLSMRLSTWDSEKEVYPIRMDSLNWTWLGMLSSCLGKMLYTPLNE